MTARLAAGRARALGLPTRGTTAPQRLRRVDRWLAGLPELRSAGPAPLVVDLGFGATPTTTIEMYARLAAVRPDVRVVGLELDPARVSAALEVPVPQAISFARGGFELAGLRPVVVRAMNVLRQYDEGAVAAAWTAMTATGALVLDGTCDEVGRRGGWIAVDSAGPRSLTLSAHLPSLGRPSHLAERLPKALIHRNVRGERVHALLAALDAAWDAAAPLSAYGPRQRFVAACGRLQDAGWPVSGGVRRWRLGELTVPWATVAPGMLSGSPLEADPRIGNASTAIED